MNNLNMAIRSLFKRGRNNVVKIISLGVGLSVGLVLIAKVCFEQSYDNFYPDSDRLYMLDMNFSRQDEVGSYPYISGGVVPGLMAEIPAIEAGTRYTHLEGNMALLTRDKQRVNGTPILADSCLFDVLPRPMLQGGKAKEILSQPMHALISSKLASRLGRDGDVVGTQFCFDTYPDKWITVGGVFEELPENSSDCYDIIISLCSIRQFTGDGRFLWLENERYLGYVKLRPGFDPVALAPFIRRVQEIYQDPDELRKMGVEVTYNLHPLAEFHARDPEVKRMSLMLSLLAFALLFTAMMNYILFVVSSMAGRSKEVAVQKCYGASAVNIRRTILTETGLHALLALVLAAGLVFSFRGTVEQMLGASLGGLFTWQTCLVLGGVFALIVAVTGLVPAWLFARVSVSSAFRGASQFKRQWKRVLLFVQFTASVFLVTLLVIVGRQYIRLVGQNFGYDYSNLLYCNTGGVPPSVRATALGELGRLPFVQGTASAKDLPVLADAGNAVMEEGKEETLFLITDLYEVDSAYLSLMDIPLLAGRPPKSYNDMLVSRDFADRASEMLGWTDGAVGKSLQVTEHRLKTICGVYENIHVGATKSAKPTAMFGATTPRDYLLVKLNALSPENIRQVDEILTRLMPDKDIQVIPYQSEVLGLFLDSKKFHDAVLLGGIITLLISLLGLVAYTQDETSRRRKEIAVRKVNGATAAEVIRMIVRGVLLVAFPAALAGVLCAYFTGEKWLAQFSEKIPLSGQIFLFGALLVLVVVTGCVVLRSWRVANENPIEALKAE